MTEQKADRMRSQIGVASSDCVFRVQTASLYAWHTYRQDKIATDSIAREIWRLENLGEDFEDWLRVSHH